MVKAKIENKINSMDSNLLNFEGLKHAEVEAITAKNTANNSKRTSESTKVIRKLSKNNLNKVCKPKFSYSEKKLNILVHIENDEHKLIEVSV